MGKADLAPVGADKVHYSAARFGKVVSVQPLGGEGSVRKVPVAHASVADVALVTVVLYRVGSGRLQHHRGQHALIQALEPSKPRFGQHFFKQMG